MDAERPRARPGVERQGTSGGGVAQPRSLLPWRHSLHPLSFTIRAHHHQTGDELHGDLQRQRGILRHTGRPDRRLDAADARLWRLLRISAHGRAGQRTSQHRAPRRRGTGPQLCDAHLHELRTVALRDRRHGTVYFAQPLQVYHHGAHKILHQRFRRGTDHGQRREGIGLRLRGDRGRGERIHGRPPSS